MSSEMYGTLRTVVFDAWMWCGWVQLCNTRRCERSQLNHNKRDSACTWEIVSRRGHKNGIENKDKEIKPGLKKDEIKRKKFARSTRYGSSRPSVLWSVFFVRMGSTWKGREKVDKYWLLLQIRKKILALKGFKIDFNCWSDLVVRGCAHWTNYGILAQVKFESSFK